jgi:hypothetical protein
MALRCLLRVCACGRCNVWLPCACCVAGNANTPMKREKHLRTHTHTHTHTQLEKQLEQQTTQRHGWQCAQHKQFLDVSQAKGPPVCAACLDTAQSKDQHNQSKIITEQVQNRKRIKANHTNLDRRRDGGCGGSELRIVGVTLRQ